MGDEDFECDWDPFHEDDEDTRSPGDTFHISLDGGKKWLSILRSGTIIIGQSPHDGRMAVKTTWSELLDLLEKRT